MKQILFDVTYLPAIHQSQNCTRCFHKIQCLHYSTTLPVSTAITFYCYIWTCTERCL